MSTLTKVLIVLLTISAIFLCGIVVTYVATADDYRQQYSKLKQERDSFRENNNKLTGQINEQIAEKDLLEKRLRSEIASLNTKLSKLDSDYKTVDREKDQLLEKVNSWTSIVKDFSETNDQQGMLLRETLEELKSIQASQIKQGKELNETTTTLIEKMAIIDTLEREKRRLLEEKTDLQDRLQAIVRPGSVLPATPTPVTIDKDRARPAKDMAMPPQLHGLVTAVDLRNSMAGISIGSADGVRENMRFHVTRGDEFICDIVVVEVDTGESVGVLELLQQSPNVGDTVGTGF